MPTQPLPRLPDFYLIGAMKCGTSSLHHLLAAHPRIFVPPGEQFFYDMDDLQQHGEFFFGTREGFRRSDFERDLARNAAWYAARYSAARPDQLWGDDSTTYLASRLAPERVARLVPSARLIVMLRDPAARTYSHYCHLLRSGRALFDFERALQFEQEQLLERSLYREQLERWRAHFPAEQLLVLLFEDFVADPIASARRALDFLGVDAGAELAQASTHKNEGAVPRWAALQRVRNYVFRAHARRGYTERLPHAPGAPSDPWGRLARIAHLVTAGVGRSTSVRPPPLAADTRAVLDDYFSRVNRGLDDLVGRDLSEVWYRSRRARAVPGGTGAAEGSAP